MDIRKIIRETIFDVLSEEALNFNSFGPNVGLVINLPSSEQIWLNFFDFSTMQCVGVITLRNIEKDNWAVTTVAAEKGFGPLMYKAGMMAVYPGKVSADKFGRPSNAAIEIWNKFFINSGEAKKEPIAKDSISYKDYGDEDLNIILNQLYSRPTSAWFNKMLARGESFLKTKSMNPESVRKICSDYFMGRYKER